MRFFTRQEVVNPGAEIVNKQRHWRDQTKKVQNDVSAGSARRAQTGIN